MKTLIKLNLKTIKMKYTFLLLFLSLIFIGGNPSIAQEERTETTQEDANLAYAYFLDSLNQSLTYETEKVTFKDGMAIMDVPNGFNTRLGEFFTFFVKFLLVVIVLTAKLQNPAEKNEAASV